MIPQIFKHKPIHDGKIILVETIAIENGEERTVPLSFMLIKQHAYRSLTNENNVRLWHEGIKNFKVHVYNCLTDKMCEKDIEYDKDGRLAFFLSCEGKKLKLYLEDFDDESKETSLDEALTEKIVEDTLKFSDILLTKAQKIAEKRYQNASIIIKDIEFDTDAKEVLVTTCYRNNSKKTFVKSFPFSDLYD